MMPRTMLVAVSLRKRSVPLHGCSAMSLDNPALDILPPRGLDRTEYRTRIVLNI